MLRRPPRSTRTDTLCPYTTLFLSACRPPAPSDTTAAGADHRPAVPPATWSSHGCRDQNNPSGRPARHRPADRCVVVRSEEHTSELQSLMRISYAVFCLKKNDRHYYSHQSYQDVYHYSYDSTY